MTLESIMNFNIGTFTTGKLVSAVITLLLCLICVRILNKIFARIIDRLKFEKSMHTFLKSVLRVLLYTLAAIITASSLGINVSAFVALLSVAGLAISGAAGFALQPRQRHHAAHLKTLCRGRLYRDRGGRGQSKGYPPHPYPHLHGR